MQSITLSSASVTDTTTYTKLDIPDGGGRMGSPQLCRVFVSATASSAPSGTGTIRFVLSDGTTVYGFRDAAVSFPTTTLRDGAGGSTGGYHMLVSFADSRDSFDLLGQEDFNSPNKLAWYAGTPAAFPTNVTAYTVYYKATGVI